MIRVRVVRDVREFEALAPSWRALLASASNKEPVKSPLWLLTWWRQFGQCDRRALAVLVAEDNGRLVGLLPLSRRRVFHRGIVPVRRLELLATGECEADEICSDYVGAIVERGAEAPVVRAFVEALASGAIGSWDELSFSAMRHDDASVEPLHAELRRAGFTTSLEQTGACPYVQLPSTFDAYLGNLGSARRYAVRRAMREFEQWANANGGYRLRRASTHPELLEGRRILQSLHSERWGARGERGVFASERFTRFHDEIIPKLFDGVDGSVDLLWLTVGGEAISAVYNIVYDSKVYFYQSGRKLDLPKGIKPGIAIHTLAIQDAIARGYREYDFLNGASQYKRQLALSTRPLVTLRAHPSSHRARAALAACAIVDAALAEVRRRRGTSGPGAANSAEGGAQRQARR